MIARIILRKEKTRSNIDTRRRATALFLNFSENVLLQNKSKFYKTKHRKNRDKYYFDTSKGYSHY